MGEQKPGDRVPRLKCLAPASFPGFQRFHWVTDLVTDLESKLAVLWRSANDVDLNSCFLYLICVIDPSGKRYSYIGKARDQSRLREYRNNMRKIQASRERGEKQKYRAVHFAMYSALRNGWPLDFYPLENCSEEELNARERLRIREHGCNLNGARTWRVADIDGISLDDLVAR